MEASPQRETPVYETKPIDLGTLHIGQKKELKGGLKDAMMSHPMFKSLGSQQKAIFYTTCDMIAAPNGIEMMDIEGEEFWEAVEVPNSKKKVKTRFVKFVFAYIVPGTTFKLSVVKRWKYEDFPQ